MPIMEKNSDGDGFFLFAGGLEFGLAMTGSMHVPGDNRERLHTVLVG
jgi:hypothetical protein